MDGWHKPDQCGGVGHGCDEEREDGAEGCKSQGNTKHACIYEPGCDVKAQMFTTELFNFGEGYHGNDFTILKNCILTKVVTLY